MDILKAESIDVFGLYVYESKIARDLQGISQEKSRKNSINLVYNFKKYGRQKIRIKREVLFLKDYFKCDLVMAIPPSSIMESNLQKLFVSPKIERIRNVISRKFHHKNNIQDDNDGTFVIPELKGKKILLIDDIATTGSTLEYFKNQLLGNDVIMAALGINKKLNPIVHEKIEPKKRAVGGQIGNINALKWTEDDAITLGNELIEWQLSGGSECILYKDFLLQRGLYSTIISYLCETFESFSNLIKRAEEIQLVKLDKYGLIGELNPAITIFIQKNCHGRRDKQEVEHSGNAIPGLIINTVSSKPKGEKKDG